jgi:hypothetical protein
VLHFENPLRRKSSIASSVVGSAVGGDVSPGKRGRPPATGKKLLGAAPLASAGGAAGGWGQGEPSELGRWRRLEADLVATARRQQRCFDGLAAYEADRRGFVERKLLGPSSAAQALKGGAAPDLAPGAGSSPGCGDRLSPATTAPLPTPPPLSSPSASLLWLASGRFSALGLPAPSDPSAASAEPAAWPSTLSGGLLGLLGCTGTAALPGLQALLQAVEAADVKAADRIDRLTDDWVQK